MADTLTRLLPIADVAEILACSERTVRALIERGELIAIRTGVRKGFRVHPDDLVAFIESRRTEPKQPRTRRQTPRPRLKHIRL